MTSRVERHLAVLDPVRGRHGSDEGGVRHRPEPLRRAAAGARSARRRFDALRDADAFRFANVLGAGPSSTAIAVVAYGQGGGAGHGRDDGARRPAGRDLRRGADARPAPTRRRSATGAVTLHPDLGGRTALPLPRRDQQAAVRPAAGAAGVDDAAADPARRRHGRCSSWPARARSRATGSTTQPVTLDAQGRRRRLEAVGRAAVVGGDAVGRRGLPGRRRRGRDGARARAVRAADARRHASRRSARSSRARCSPSRATRATRCSSCSTACSTCSVDGSQARRPRPRCGRRRARDARESSPRTATLTALTPVRVAEAPADALDRRRSPISPRGTAASTPDDRLGTGRR